jgi:hypothetical protein
MPLSPAGAVYAERGGRSPDHHRNVTAFAAIFAVGDKLLLKRVDTEV